MGETELLNFGGALEALRDGEKLARDGWNGNGMWVVLSPGFRIPRTQIYARHIADEVGGGEGTFREYLMMRTANGEFVPWVASQTDLLAGDWRIV